MARVFRCNRCGTVFTQKTDYSILKIGKPKTPSTPAVATEWIDLCGSCTLAFDSWLHPTNNNERGGGNE